MIIECLVSECTKFGRFNDVPEGKYFLCSQHNVHAINMNLRSLHVQVGDVFTVSDDNLIATAKIETVESKY